MRTYLQEKEHWVTILKQELERSRKVSKATKVDIAVVLEDYIITNLTGINNYMNTQNTKLYLKYGGEYCSLLEYLNYIHSDGKFKELFRLASIELQRGGLYYVR